jgi:acetyltransferase-like isoleucine patch superfamily enzyme
MTSDSPALVVRAYYGLASRARNWVYRQLGVKMTGYVLMRAVEIPRNWKDITLEGDVALDRGVVLLCSGPHRPNKLVVRAGTYVNRYTMFDVHERLEVGRDCMIGPHCYFTDSDHGVALGRSVRSQPMHSAAVVLEDEVWLGAHSVVLRGVRIGKGAVIGAGSVVTSDIPANAIAAGAPARVVRMRA